MSVFYYNLKGSIIIILMSLNTLVGAVFLIPASFLKLIFRIKPAQRFLTYMVTGIANTWMRINLFILSIFHDTKWIIENEAKLEQQKSYLVLSNHQTWTDIIVLMKIFLGKIPFLKFFLKKELRWVPVLGIAWWALDYPFMKRYPRSLVEKKPHLKGKDIEITRKACERFKGKPVTVMNFVEGTRFRPEKHRAQGSPFKNLLRPKAGGVGFVFTTMGEQISSILNVTIAYPDGVYSFWEYICGRVKTIKVHVEEIPVTENLLGDYVNDPAFRDFFQKWINGLWVEKDKKLEQML
mgnify:CR=1 FL=1